MFELLPLEVITLIIRFILHSPCLWKNEKKLSWEEWVNLELRSYHGEALVYNRISMMDPGIRRRLAKGVVNSEGITWCKDVIKKARVYIKNHDKDLSWDTKVPIHWISRNDFRNTQNLLKWEKTPFSIMLPFINCCKSNRDLAKTNEFWYTHLVLDFRKGIDYNNRPVNAKEKYLEKTKKIILGRYKPIIETLLDENEESSNKILFHRKNMKIMLDKIREVELTETDSIDDIISETPLYVRMPDIYRAPDQINIDFMNNTNIRMTYKMATRHINEHEKKLNQSKRNYKNNKTMLDKLQPYTTRIDEYVF